MLCVPPRELSEIGPRVEREAHVISAGFSYLNFQFGWPKTIMSANVSDLQVLGADICEW